MRRFITKEPEIVRAAHNTPAKVMLPQAIGHHLGSHGILRTRNPLGEHAAFTGGLIAVPVPLGNISLRITEDLRE